MIRGLELLTLTRLQGETPCQMRGAPEIRETVRTRPSAVHTDGDHLLELLDCGLKRHEKKKKIQIRRSSKKACTKDSSGNNFFCINFRKTNVDEIEN
ncbi:hypothetical protein CEXT_63011 [Caerostris extrusa]|uniref:Uncharacterized protein n=1 Tax=Caerostris extrusa TaxID=172846 RepID=A0AAV4VPA5_CAEEX|nr:hypothetical protein CEXT_63011 [Caerostris extrusa]